MACLLATIVLGWTQRAPSAALPTGLDSGQALRTPGEDGGIPVRDGRAAAVAKARRLPSTSVARLPAAGVPVLLIDDRQVLASRSLLRDPSPPASALESPRPGRSPRLSRPPGQAPPSA